MPFDHFGRSKQKPLEICRNAATAKAVNVAHEDDALQCLEEVHCLVKVVKVVKLWEFANFALVTSCNIL